MAILGIGALLGRYRLEERIGAGGMAEVWRALDLGLERRVALKVMSPDTVAADATFVPRFLREAKLSAKLEHPHVLPIYDFGQVDDLLFLVMPLLAGGTLRDRARSGVSPLLAMEWLKSLAGALDYAHGEGVVHRDVKPANVLFDKTNRLFLADFGLAREAGSASLTVAGTVLGTPVYMSPEQVRGEAASPRSDQYALATVLFLVWQAPDRSTEWIGALSITMAVSAIILVLAERIQRIAGDRFVVALERLMGLVLVAMSIEMMLRGIKTFVMQLAHP